MSINKKYLPTAGYTLYWLGVLFLAFLLISSARAEVEVPSHPTNSYVLDKTNTLTQADFQKIDNLAKGLEASKKVSLAVLVIPTLDGQDIAQYSLGVAEKWKPGIDGIGKGAILVIAKNDRKFRVEVSKNLEGELPDVTIKSILDGSKHFFKEGLFGDGIYSILSKLGAKVGNEAAAPMITTKVEEEDNLLIILLSFFGVVGLTGSIPVWLHLKNKAEEEARRKYLLEQQEEYERAIAKREEERRAIALAKEKLMKNKSLDLKKSTFSPAYDTPLEFTAGLSGASINRPFIPPAYTPPVRKIEPTRKPEQDCKSRYSYGSIPIVVATPSYESSRSSRSSDSDSSSSSWSSSSSSDCGGGGSSSSWD